MIQRGMAVGALVALGVAFGSGLFFGAKEWNSSLLQAATSAVGLSLPLTSDKAPPGLNEASLWRAWNLLEENYIETTASSTTPSEEERLWGAIDGLTQSYKDPYTVFLPPEEAEMFEEEIRGAFEGVGMELGLKDEELVVIAPLKGSPAERAGIQTGDLILGIDGKSTEGMAIEDAVKLIRGEKGTTVLLTVLHDGIEESEKISIVRDTINIPVIKQELTEAGALEGGIYVIEVYSFSATSPELFRSALRDFMRSGTNKLLLDLRGNPGGFLEAAVHMASFFLPVGEIVVTEDFKGNQENINHRSVGYDVFKNRNLKMAILVNQGSASASEILAGALQQHGVATLVGDKTFGKGSVQELLEIGGGAELKVTIARWLTPDGTSISDGGLDPDIEVERTAEDAEAGRDPQKEAAIEWLKNQ
jgi:carboxyl-terminal processing protease